jgi:UPF0176 protein
MQIKSEYRVLLYYKYTKIDNPNNLMDIERSVCEVLDLKGRIIIAEEGINGTVEGTFENTEKYIKHLKKDKRFKNMDIKQSIGRGNAFPRLSIKVRDEIVSTKLPKHLNPAKKTVRHILADDLHKMYRNNEDFLVVDMRNDYELASGYFKNTIDIGLKNSRDLNTEEVMNKLRVHKDKKIITVCTGGVRCEKMAAYLVDEGFSNVNQLYNGIHSYMEKFPGEDWLGTLYTFDQRVTMDFGGDKNGERVIVGKCIGCGSQSESYYDIYENYVDDKNGRDRVKDTHVLMCDECATARNATKHASRKELVM